MTAIKLFDVFEKEKREIEEQRERILKLLIEEEERRRIENQLQLQEENDRKKEKEKREIEEQRERIQKLKMEEEERIRREIKLQLQEEEDRKKGSYAKAIESCALTGAEIGNKIAGFAGKVGGGLIGGTTGALYNLLS